MAVGDGGDGIRHHTLAASPMEVEVLRRVGNSVSKCALGMMHVPGRCLDSMCHAVASAHQEAIWTMYTGCLGFSCIAAENGRSSEG